MNQAIDLRAFTNSATLPTLVLVDLQEEYLAAARALAIPNVETALANCRDALAHARLMGIPVAYTRWLGSTLFDPEGRFYGSIKGFEPHGSDSIFERKQPSCYASRHFAEVMTNNSGNIIIAGFAGEAACLSTAIEAFHRGHRVTYLADASASHSLGGRPAADVHAFVCQMMQLWGDVVPTEAWIKATSHAAAWQERSLQESKP